MDITRYTYNGKSWRRCPTISDSNSFFHAAFGVWTDESGAYLDEQAKCRRMIWATVLTYFENEDIPSCLEDTLKKCLSAQDKYESIDIKQNLTQYTYDIMAGERAVTKEEIPVLAALENVKVVVLSEGRGDPITVIEPNPNILGSYLKEFPKEKPKEVVVCLEVNVFARLEPVNNGVCPKPNKNKVESKTDPSKYRKGGSAGSKGVEYQVYLLATVILNALKKALSQWKLSTENEDAGKFDDIVLEWSEGAVLIQSKHKESNNKKITLEELTSTNSKHDDFSLPKYFLSYMLIKEKFNVKNVILCTNAGVNQTALNFLDRQGENSESLLHHEDGDCSFYTLKGKFLPNLIETTVSYYRQNFRDKGIEESVITEENLEDFSKHFQIYFNYPPLKTLEKNIEKLLSLTKCCGNSQGKITSLEMFSKVMDWFQQKEGVYFTELHAKAMFAEIWTHKYCQKLVRYKVSLQRNDLNFQGPKQIFHVAVSHGHLLQAIKTYHAVQNYKEKILFTSPDDDIDTQKVALEAFGLPKYVFLIVIVLEVKEESVIMDMWDKLRDVLDKNKYKKVIFINGSNDTFFSHIGPCYETVDGFVTFEDLSRGSQERLLKKKNIVFQGRSVCLEELLAARTTEDCLKAVDAEILEKIIVGEEVKVGMRPLDLDENTARFYINRTFKRTNEEIDEHNIYDVKQDVVLLSDGAGMGKSTALSNLATTIKNRNPHLWVIKIALTEYTGILRDALTNHRETVNVVELLNSKKSTKLTNNLERFVFSMDKRIVLMLDGIDEISPDYTELVLSLLTECLQTVNFAKLFVTTRPHMVQKLENVLKVKPFVLHPFTEENQVNYLTSYWVHNLNIDGENEGKCENYAKVLIGRMPWWTKHCYDDEHDFAAIPLQLRILAEVFQQSPKHNGQPDWEGCKECLEETKVKSKLPVKINIKKLYEMFFEKKRDIYLCKGNPDGNTAANGPMNKQFDGSLTYYKKLALEVILDKEDSQLFSCLQQKCHSIDENTLKIGIVQKSNDELQFIHRTFAEYFVAECLFRELQDQSHKPNIKFQQFFIDEVLQSSDYRVVRTFLDNFLLEAGNIPSNSFESYQLNISGTVCRNSYKGAYYKYFIHSLAEEGCVAILQLVLNCVSFKVIKDKEVNIKYTENKRICKETNGFPSGIEFKDNTLNILQVFAEKGGVNIRNMSSEMPLHCAAQGGHLEMVKFLVEQGAKIDCRDVDGLVPLLCAAKNGHLDTVKFFLEQGANLTTADEMGRSALHLAAWDGHMDTVKFLLQQGANLTAVDNLGMSALHLAAWNGHTDTVRFLLERGANLTAADEVGRSVLHLAAWHGHMDTVNFLLEQGANLTAADEMGRSVLHLAAWNGHMDTVKFLLEQGANLTAVDNGCILALNFAAGHGDLNTVKFLLEQGINLTAVDEIGRSALHNAAENGYLDTVKFLLERGADLSGVDRDGMSALHFAAWNGHMDTVKFLLEQGANLTSVDNGCISALHVAAQNGHLDTMKFLLEQGANLNTVDRNGMSVLHFAVRDGHLDTIEFLIGLGVHVNVGDKDNSMPLHLAASTGQLAVVEYLVNLGGDVNFQDDNGRTAMHFAALNGHLDIIEFLLEIGADLNIRDTDGLTELHLATINCKFDTARFLFELGVDFSIEDDGSTPLHLAAAHGHLYTVMCLLRFDESFNVENFTDEAALLLPVVESLVKTCGDVNVKDENGRTPLHLAASNGHLEIVTFLLELDANDNVKDKDGNTAQLLALAQNRPQIVDYFTNINKQDVETGSKNE